MIGVIADDLTGAAELGALGWRHGLRAEIVRSGKPSGAAGLVCVDTDSRACDPDEAAKRAAAAAKMLRAAGAKWIYKKVDSVLRGQVTAELEAVLKQLKLQRALLLPANPTLGRTIKDGHYFLNGKPLHKTEFGHDPHFPRRSSQVLRLVKVPEMFSMRVANGDRAVADGMIVIGDAQSALDLQRWAENCDAQMLPAGGADFFGALLKNKRAGILSVRSARNDAQALPIKCSPSRRDEWPVFTGKEFFIVGTATAAAKRFVTAARRRKTPVFALPQELAWGATFSAAAVEAVTLRVEAAFKLNSRVILHVGLPQVRAKDVAGQLSGHVVRVAERVLRTVPVENIFAEGGATAAELVRRMNWPLLEIVRELAPGVATLAVVGDRKFLLTIKPGSYSWPEKFACQ